MSLAGNLEEPDDAERNPAAVPTRCPASTDCCDAGNRWARMQGVVLRLFFVSGTVRTALCDAARTRHLSAITCSNAKVDTRWYPLTVG